MPDSRFVFDIQSLVYEGVWKNHSEQPFKRWIWTLKDSKALICLACLSILIAFAQTRAWVIVRYVIYQRTKSVRLPGDNKPDDRQTLSQGEAMAEALPSIRIWAKILWCNLQQFRSTPQSRRDSVPASGSPLISPWFGTLALLNVTVFVVMGVVAPWALSNGSLETPIVTSKSTEACLAAHRYERIRDLIRGLTKTDAILEQCQNRLDASCNEQFYLRTPQVQKRRVETCPFPTKICHNGTKPVEMTHWNIDAYEAGVNSRTKVTMNHRLTCAPIYLRSLYLFRVTKSSPPRLSNALIRVQAGRNLSGSYTMELRTLNGPNSASEESSGRQMAEADVASDFTVLPRYFATANPQVFHSDLSRSDAMPFLVIYRAGGAKNHFPEDDAFFAAHTKRLDDNGTFYADLEATALGCTEQFQFCLTGPDNCTAWGQGSNPVYELARHPDIQRDEAALGDIYTLFRIFPALFSVYGYLAIRVTFLKMIPLTTINYWHRGYSSQERWVTEVETWFAKGILDAILLARSGAEFPLDNGSDKWEPQFRKKHSLCGRILFRNEGYTNINWVGVWVLASILMFIFLTSFLVERIHQSGAKLCKHLIFARCELITLSNTGIANMQLWWSSTKEIVACFVGHVEVFCRSSRVFYMSGRIQRRGQAWWRSGFREASSATAHQTTPGDTGHDNSYPL
jgi:hypothetical protein